MPAEQHHVLLRGLSLSRAWCHEEGRGMGMACTA